jgi:protein-S-isoprenylcysteine O-methyltransferase Ste14
MATATRLRTITLPSIFSVLIVAAALFGAAGRVDLPEFWLYLAVLAVFSAAATIAIDPDLAQERMRPGGQRLPNTMLLIGGVLPLLHLAAAGLDRGRLHWTDTVPATLQVAALLLFALGCLLVLWAMHVNRFFSSVARIQQDRGQHVVDTGPYRIVRHPGYAAGLVLALTSGVALGSWFAAALGWIGVPLLLRRTIAEDRMLRAELPGYAQYTAHVRYRLIPALW